MEILFKHAKNKQGEKPGAKKKKHHHTFSDYVIKISHQKSRQAESDGIIAASRLGNWLRKIEDWQISNFSYNWIKKKKSV